MRGKLAARSRLVRSSRGDIAWHIRRLRCLNMGVDIIPVYEYDDDVWFLYYLAVVRGLCAVEGEDGFEVLF